MFFSKHSGKQENNHYNKQYPTWVPTSCHRGGQSQSLNFWWICVNMSFPILLKLNQQQAKFQPMKPPTIMGCIYVANTRLWNLSLKSPVCCEQLIHTKDNQSSKARKIMCALWTMPIYNFLERQGLVQNRLSQMTWDITGLHLREVFGLILTFDFTNTASYVICILSIL